MGLALSVSLPSLLRAPRNTSQAAQEGTVVKSRSLRAQTSHTRQQGPLRRTLSPLQDKQTDDCTAK